MTTRTLLSKSELDLIWQRRNQGIRMAYIAKELGRDPVTLLKLMRRTGGIKPYTATRSSRHLCFEERESIMIGLAQGKSIRLMARESGRAPSTISREIKRNAPLACHRYLASVADKNAYKRAKRPKICKLDANPALKKVVEHGLNRKWSPEEISIRLAHCHKDDPAMQISHETIYKALYIQSRGTLKNELKKQLRRQNPYRKSRNLKHTKDARGQIDDRISISERPPEVEDRAVPGHWEGDLVMGTIHCCIATLVERSTRFVMLAKVESKSTDDVVPALVEQMKLMPEHLKKSLTWDRGVELNAHKKFTMETDMKVYFCDPHSPWQRGSNENTNGLLRQYFPKSEPIGHYTQEELDEVARELNGRPRKTLNAYTPAEKLEELLSVALTG